MVTSTNRPISGIAEADVHLTRRHANLGLMALMAMVGASPARAHAHLVAATPPVDGTVRTPPKLVTISFTEKLEGKLSSIVVKDAAGRRVDADDTRLAGSAGKTLTVTLRDLAPGAYSVAWTAASVDTHRTTGTFGFTVKP
jgi:hypothetical protein